MPDPLAGWPAFAASIRDRLEAGRREYGDRSFSRDPEELIGEIEQELLDVVGWAYVLHHRLERMRQELEAQRLGEQARQALGYEPEDGMVSRG